MRSSGRADPVPVRVDSRIPRYAVAVCFTLLWVAVLLAQPSLKPLAAVLAGGATGATALAMFAFHRRRLPGEARWALVAGGIGLAALLAGALSKPAPLVSIFGVAGQHNGWLMWAIMLLWLAVGTQMGRGRQMRALIWSVAVLGTVAAVFALLDATHLVEFVRYSPEVAGLMESSISLGQILLLSLGATAAAVTMERSWGVRSVVAAAFLLQVAALAVSSARGAQLTFLVAALVAALWVLGGKLSPGLRRTLWAVVAAGLVAAIAAVAVFAWLGPVRLSVVDRLLTGRPTIWHSAWGRLPAHLLLGEGPDRFTSLVAWSLKGGYIDWTATNSPHDVLLDWALGGGLAALGAFLSAFVLAGRGVARRLAASPPGPRILAIGAGAWAVSLLTSWIDPLSAFAAALIVGAVLSQGDVERVVSPARTATTATIVAVAIAMLVIGVPLFGIERGWASERGTATVDLAAQEARWERWPDPAFGGDALRTGLAGLPASAPATGRLASEVLARTPWDVNGALESVEAVVGVGQAVPSAQRPSLAQALAVGRDADPASPIWDRLKALLGSR